MSHVLVTGGAGFLGSWIVRGLTARGYTCTVARSREYDLREAAACSDLLSDSEPDWVIHAAVNGGGIGYMRAHAADVIHDNVLMSTHLMEACRRQGIQRFVGVSSVCAYPRIVPIPMREPDPFQGYPEPSNAGYGLSKRLMMEHGRALHEQYGMRCVFPMPTNLYGPGDDFDPRSSHVVPALIRRCLEAVDTGAESITAWGTGTATRELLYVEDCAQAIIAMAEQWESPEPVNIGNGEEFTIKRLVHTIAEHCGFEGEILWDTSKPDGQPRKCLDTSRAQQGLGWTAQVDLHEGLKRTISWYRENREA